MKLGFLFTMILVGLLCVSAAAQETKEIRCIEGLRNNKRTFEKWLATDALYIITESEKQAALALQTEAEQDRFVESFWRRRDPDPKTEINEFREAYYERIAYANEHFAAGVPGWRTDRGKIYILFGAPDRTEKGRAAFDGLENVLFEKWHYRQVTAIGSPVELTFIDPSESQEFRLIKNPENEFLDRPRAGLTVCAMCPSQ